MTDDKQRLTLAAENALITAAQKGDKEAGEQLFRLYLPLIKRAAGIANKRRRFDLYDDAYQAASEAFWKGVLVFDPKKGSPFAAYVRLACVGAARNVLREDRRRGATLSLEQELELHGDTLGAPAPEVFDEAALPLGEKELWVAKALLIGIKPAEIAAKLRVSPQRVSFIRRNAGKKLLRYLKER